jgi:hypothetical protein
MTVDATRFDPYAPTPDWTPPLEQPWVAPTMGLPMETPDRCSPFNPYAQCGALEGLPGVESDVRTLTVEDEGGFAFVAQAARAEALDVSQPVPEPAALVLAALGMAMLARRLRR